MFTKEQIRDGFALNLSLLRRQCDSLTHADSLLQPPFRGNCMNWVLGHILINRDRVLHLLQAEPTLAEAKTGRYESGSDPITEDSDAILPLEELLDKLSLSQERIAAGLDRMDESDLSIETESGGRKMSIGQRIFGLYFHDTYHTGQTEFLRQLAGKDDKIV